MLRALRLLSPLLALIDVALVVGALNLAEWLRQRLALGIALNRGEVWLTGPIVAAAALVWAACFYLVGAHQARRFIDGDGWRRLMLANAIGTLLFVASLFFLKVYDFSRLLVGYFFVIAALLLLARDRAVRLVLCRMMRPFERRVLFVGGGEIGALVAARLASTPFGMRLVGIVSTDVEAARQSAVGGLTGAAFADGSEAGPGPLRLGPIDQVPALAREYAIDEVMLALPAEQHDLAEQVIQDLDAIPVRIHFVPDVLELAMIRATVVDFFGIPVVGLREPPLDDMGRVLKRAFDLVAGAVLTLLAGPVLIACAIAIKLQDGGPVFFRQRRVGENGALFNMLKFRSMVVDAEARLKSLGIDREKLSRDNPVFKVKDDPRVTAVGRFIRRWSLDELPQLINVLKGDMSLVGPRPEEAAVVAQYNRFYRKRLAVKPGITGPMQVNGRGDLPLKQRLNLELAYIETWTLWSDLKILAKTIPVVLGGKGAY